MPEDPAAHGQRAYDVRCDWGPTGGAALVADLGPDDVAVVVDVLSFTTTLSIAVARGTRVHPFRWRDERAVSYAAERGAALAVGRLEARDLADRPGGPPPSLSPALLLAAEPLPAIVLPSPNGSTICAALGAGGVPVVGGALRNASAVAAHCADRVAGGARVAVVAAGERWPDGTLRPAVEDLWGAGAVLAALRRQLPGGERTALSPEAEAALAAYERVAADLPALLPTVAGGRELDDAGFGADVAAAADRDAEDVVPVLTGDGFVDAPTA
ncbi:2-phosphosulfolactate phosphatase [Nocardioides sp. YIM 152588]|uniref:2-phosphosulfolactate phosphatase n=1 Tax=Nocardioides sp. YIM 152588 TaxID=3158259 RepID=UPI0032E431FC